MRAQNPCVAAEHRNPAQRVDEEEDSLLRIHGPPGADFAAPFEYGGDLAGPGTCHDGLLAVGAPPRLEAMPGPSRRIYLRLGISSIKNMNN